MQMSRLIPLFLFTCLALSVAGCADVPPYVYNKEEFNRASTNFGKEPKDISEVIICYNKGDSTPQQIVALAKAECGKVGKAARFVKQRRLTCPIMTPISAEFACDAPVQDSSPWPGGSPVR